MSLDLELHIVGELGTEAGELGDTLAAVRGTGTRLIVRYADITPADAITAAVWRDDRFEFWAFDRRLDDLVARGVPVALAASTGDAPALVREVATRCQRLAPRRNAATAGGWFDRVLDEHRALHDLARPLVRADFDHALDAWQWSVRLDPGARAAVQLAVLLHDIERLATEADERIEHRAADYQAFKDAHARAGAELARALLSRAGVASALADEVAALVAVHERPSAAPADHAIRAINDADALSWFSFNSPGYLAYFGAAQTATKVAYTLARMSARARRELAALRMPQLVRGQLEGLLHRDHLA
jgi:hypothetical protein